MKDKTYEEFSLYCKNIEQVIEQRRKSYALRFKAFVVIAALLIPLIVISVMIGLISNYSNDTIYMYVFTGLFLELVFIRMAMLQFIRYKIDFKRFSFQRFAAEKDSILKDIIFSEFLKFFGDFKFKLKNKISLNDISKSGIIPDSDNYSGEDLITGEIHQSKIEICEAKFTNLVAGKPIDFFNGLLVLIDVCNPDIKLRGGFNGHTVLITDQHKHENILQGRFSELSRLKLADSELESEFELFTNNEDEARKILPNALLKELKDLAEYLASVKEQKEHIEDKLMYGFERALLSTSGFLKAILSRLPGRENKDLNLRDFNEVFDLTKHNAISDEVISINSCLQVAAYKDKFLITIPYSHDLFEPNSLFSAPMIEEDKQILFRIMNLVDTVTRLLVSKT
jgi:hypothetical protein